MFRACLPVCTRSTPWQRNADGSYVYDPPQTRCDSPWCWLRAADLALTPCALGYACACFPAHLVWSPAAFERAAASAAPASAAPPQWRGVWFMQDNVLPESFVTFDDAEWTPRRASKRTRYGWSREPTALGLLFHACSQCVGSQALEKQADGTWKPHDGFLFELQATDRLVDLRGEQVHVQPGDMVRVFTVDPDRPDSPAHFVYLLRRVTAGTGGTTSFSHIWPQLYQHPPSAGRLAASAPSAGRLAASAPSAGRSMARG